MNNLSVALCHDWLIGLRGGEKVLFEIASIFENSPIFTLFYNKKEMKDIFPPNRVVTSFLNLIPGVLSFYRYLLPLYPLAVESFDLKGFNLVITTSHSAIKGVIPSPEAINICYCFSPMRYIWDQVDNYFPKYSKLLVLPIIHYLRLWDSISSKRVDKFIAISNFVAKRINRYYRRNAVVVHPPVDTNFFNIVDEQRENFFLVVSALVPYKKIEIAIEAVKNRGSRLVIVGDGPTRKKLQKISNSNITFVNRVSKETLRKLYSRAIALIQSWEEDFGLSTVEALACGTPVVALGKGGVLDIVRDGIDGSLYKRNDPETLSEALDRVEKMNFNREELRARSLLFSVDSFRTSFLREVEGAVRR